MTITFDDFLKVEVRAGKIISVEDYPEAKKPSYKIKIDFGSEIGVKQSSVQITKLYSKEELIGKQVLGVVNFPPKQIGKFMSEVLTLGVADKDGNVVLIKPDKEAPLGGRMF